MRLARELIVQFVCVGMLRHLKGLGYVCLWPTLPAQFQNEWLLHIEHDARNLEVDNRSQLFTDHASEQFAHCFTN